MITDPWFYAAAIPAVLLFGISKGGFGGGFGVIAVPLMALVVSPPQAAGILLPILCLMDLFSVRAYRNKWVSSELIVLLPASMLGIGLGTWLFRYMSADLVRLVLGAVAVAFANNVPISKLLGRSKAPAHFSKTTGMLGGAVAGFTSFVAHAGGPPINMYLLRRPLDRTAFVGTTVLFFAVVNYVKLVPYAWLGQLATDNLSTSLVLAPIAPIGVWLGVYLHKRVSETFFFATVYVLLFAIGVKLIWDGAAAL